MTTDIKNALQASFVVCLGDFFNTPAAKQTIDSVLAVKLGSFFDAVSNRTNVPVDDLVAIFKSCGTGLPAPEKPVAEKPVAEKPVAEKPVESPKKKTVASKPKNTRKKASPKQKPKCQMILTGRSARKGQPCGKNCKAGEQYCGTHLKTQKTKLAVPPRKPVQADPEPEPQPEPQPEQQGEDVSINHNKFGNLQDPETFFVFKDGHDNPPMVFGKQDPETGSFLEVTDEDREYIQEQGWDFHVDDGAETEVDEDTMADDEEE